MGSVNKAIMCGRVGRDPEIRNDIANLSLATSETWKDKRSGERVERTEWVRVSVFNQALVGVIQKYVHKGDLVYVEGKLQTRTWKDRNDIERRTTEVVLSSYDGVLRIMHSTNRKSQESEPARRSDGKTPAGPDLDDEIPF
jgi:single-strand DNA-binding protein